MSHFHECLVLFLLAAWWLNSVTRCMFSFAAGCLFIYFFLVFFFFDGNVSMIYLRQTFLQEVIIDFVLPSVFLKVLLIFTRCHFLNIRSWRVTCYRKRNDVDSDWLQVFRKMSSFKIVDFADLVVHISFFNTFLHKLLQLICCISFAFFECEIDSFYFKARMVPLRSRSVLY